MEQLLAALLSRWQTDLFCLLRLLISEARLIEVPFVSVFIDMFSLFHFIYFRGSEGERVKWWET